MWEGLVDVGRVQWMWGGLSGCGRVLWMWEGLVDVRGFCGCGRVCGCARVQWMCEGSVHIGRFNGRGDQAMGECSVNEGRVQWMWRGFWGFSGCGRVQWMWRGFRVFSGWRRIQWAREDSVDGEGFSGFEWGRGGGIHWPPRVSNGSHSLRSYTHCTQKLKQASTHKSWSRSDVPTTSLVARQKLNIASAREHACGMCMFLSRLTPLLHFTDLENTPWTRHRVQGWPGQGQWSDKWAY